MVPNIQKNTLGQQGSTLNQLQGSLSRVNIATKSTSKMESSTKKYNRSSSWQELSAEPDFNIGLIIDSTCIKDTYVSAINKPASRCTLSSVVVLGPCAGETTSSRKDSVGRWLKANKVSANVEHLDFIGTGQNGCDEMLSSNYIDAVYIIVPTRYVSHLY